MTASVHRTQGHLPRLLSEDEVRKQGEPRKRPARRVKVTRAGRRAEINVPIREVR